MLTTQIKFILSVIAQIAAIILIIGAYLLGWLGLPAKQYSPIASTDFFESQEAIEPPSNSTNISESNSPASYWTTEIYWNFDEGSGTIAADQTNSANGQLMNSPRWLTGSECISGGCLKLNGQNQYVSLYLPQAQQYSFSGWVKPLSAITTESQILGTSSDDPGVTIYDTGQFLFFTNHGRGVLIGGPIVKSGQFYHIAVTNDGRYKKMYVNGVLANLEDTSLYGEKFIRVDNGDVAPPSFGATTFGATTNNKRFFHGVIDEFKFFPRALSEAEVEALSNPEINR